MATPAKPPRPDRKTGQERKVTQTFGKLLQLRDAMLALDGKGGAHQMGLTSREPGYKFENDNVYLAIGVNQERLDAVLAALEKTREKIALRFYPDGEGKPVAEPQTPLILRRWKAGQEAEVEKAQEQFDKDRQRFREYNEAYQKFIDEGEFTVRLLMIATADLKMRENELRGTILKSMIACGIAILPKIEEAPDDDDDAGTEIDGDPPAAAEAKAA